MLIAAFSDPGIIPRVDPMDADDRSLHTSTQTPTQGEMQSLHPLLCTRTPPKHSAEQHADHRDAWEAGAGQVLRHVQDLAPAALRALQPVQQLH